MGIVGTVVALALCAQMLRDVRRSRTRLAAWELAILTVHRRQTARTPTPFDEVVAYFRDVYVPAVAKAVNDAHSQWIEAFAPIAKAFRDAGLIIK